MPIPAQPSTQDFIPPFDPTNLQQISGAQLLQLVSGLVPNIQEGLCLMTADINGVPVVPDAITNTKWQNYLWIRVQNTTASVYVFSPNGGRQNVNGIDFQYWIAVAVAIPNLSIVNAMLAPLSVTADKVVSVDWSQITNIPASGYIPGGAAGGVLSGTYPNPSIGNGQITAPMLASGSITPNSFGSNAVVSPITNILIPGGWLPGQVIKVNSGATGFGAETDVITTLTNPIGANSGQLVQVNPQGTGFQYANQNGQGSPGRILQIQTKFDATIDNTTAQFVYNETPTTAGGKVIPGLGYSFTPLNASSTILIELTIYGGIGNSLGGVFCALFCLFANTTCIGANLLSMGVSNLAPTHGTQTIHILASIVPGSTNAIPFSVYYGQSSDAVGCTVYYNSNPNSYQYLNGVIKSSIKITEYL